MARFILVLRWILQGSGEDCGVVSDCEELSGGYSQGMSMSRIGVPKSQFSCRLILMIMKCKYIHL